MPWKHTADVVKGKIQDGSATRPNVCTLNNTCCHLNHLKYVVFVAVKVTFALKYGKGYCLLLSFYHKEFLRCSGISSSYVLTGFVCEKNIKGKLTVSIKREAPEMCRLSQPHT